MAYLKVQQTKPEERLKIRRVGTIEKTRTSRKQDCTRLNITHRWQRWSSKGGKRQQRRKDGFQIRSVEVKRQHQLQYSAKSLQGEKYLNEGVAGLNEK